MADFEYESLKEHLHEMELFYRMVADSVLQAAQDGGIEDSIDVYPEDLPDGFDFPRDRELIAEMLAERPEVDFVEHHNNGFCLQLREPVMTEDELAFAAQMQHIVDADMDNLGAWLEHMRSRAICALPTAAAATNSSTPPSATISPSCRRKATPNSSRRHWSRCCRECSAGWRTAWLG